MLNSIFFTILILQMYLGDVIGSVEAILDVLETYKSTKCKLDIIHYGVGSVSISDIEYADTFQGRSNY